MSAPQPPLNKTPAREEALRDVLFGLISYNPLFAVYLKDAKQVSGAKRRTLAELRGYALIVPGSTTKVAKVKLTATGDALATEWGLKKASAEATE